MSADDLGYAGYEGELRYYWWGKSPPSVVDTKTGEYSPNQCFTVLGEIVERDGRPDQFVH
jgi:hypothetical protein